MFAYKNTSLSVKTFYGVTFKPGDVNEVPGFINDPSMIRVTAKPKEPPKVSDVKKSPKVVQPSEESEVQEHPIKSDKSKVGGEPNGTDND